MNIHWKDWCWSWSSNTLATWCEELIHWKRPWCWEWVKVGGEGDNRGWDGWMASTWWPWVWASSGSWWWTEKPGVLQSVGSQRVGHDWATGLNWTAAAAAAKSLQSCPTLCDPIDGSPPGSAIPGILPAGTLEWVAISFSSAWKWKVKVIVKLITIRHQNPFLGFPGGSVVKNPPAMQETQVWYLGWEDPLEKGMATPSSILAWRIPRTEEPGGLQSTGLQRVAHIWATNTPGSLACLGPSWALYLILYLYFWHSFS